MALRNSKTGWGLPARALHWAMAALILFMLVLGFYMADFVTDTYERFALVQLHKSWGFVAFVLALLRLLWRFANPAPELPAHMGALERFLAHAGHWALYALMVALPLSGWLMASASELQEMYGIKNMVFGLFEMPDPFKPGNRALGEVFAAIHGLCAFALIAVLIGHALAALKHHFFNRDRVLMRMVRGE